MIHPDVERVLYTEDELRSRIGELGRQITADYAGRRPMLEIGRASCRERV